MTYRTRLLGGRVPLPTRLRALAGVSDGDPVDVTVVKGGLLVTPARRAPEIAKPASQTQQRRALVAPLREEAPESLKAMWADARRQGTGKPSMREIDAIIAQYQRVLYKPKLKFDPRRVEARVHQPDLHPGPHPTLTPLHPIHPRSPVICCTA
jgi:hypothetical protein